HDSEVDRVTLQPSCRSRLHDHFLNSQRDGAVLPGDQRPDAGEFFALRHRLSAVFDNRHGSLPVRWSTRKGLSAEDCGCDLSQSSALSPPGLGTEAVPLIRRGWPKGPIFDDHPFLVWSKAQRLLLFHVAAGDAEKKASIRIRD